MGILKTEKRTRTERINCRATLQDYYDIKKKAMIYTDGNISEYVIYAAKNYTPHQDELKTPLTAGARKKPGKKRIY